MFPPSTTASNPEETTICNSAKRLKITFLLPGAGHTPVGGFKVAYEYANHLSRRGHQVTVVHPASLRVDGGTRNRARSTFRYLYRKGNNSYKPDSWFQIDPAVRLLWVPSLSEQNIPDGEVVIATAWQTAEWAAKYPDAKGRRFYLVQQLETWHGEEDRVYATWKAPLKKIVISEWLRDLAHTWGEECWYIPNGLDFQKFWLTNPVEKRDPHSVMMLYHSAADKGSADGLKALSLVHGQESSLRVTLFGTPKIPDHLPDWAQYHRQPKQEALRDLYNRHAIFVTPSWTEGWALPPAEAMTCGAALAATDIGGHHGYAIHERTAMLSPAKSPELLAQNILRLMRDDSLRLTLAKSGHDYVQQFTWERSVQQMEEVILSDDS